MKLEPNTTISHYKILSSIGQGGMCVSKLYDPLDSMLKINHKPRWIC
jgi:hypothetical protein